MTNAPRSTDMKTASMILTAQDVERLLKDDSADSRVNVLEKVTKHYDANVFAGREREVAEQIFRLLMKDAVIRVRETLAERIRENPDIPRDIILHMANDVDSVALPVLESTTVLSDADFVNIIEASNDLGKLMAISKRPTVSERVSDALAETNYPQVVTSLLENDGAQISERTLDNIVSEFRGHPGVIESMVERRSLPITLVERLVTEASDAIAEQLSAKYNLNKEDVRKEASSSHDDVMLRMMKYDITDEEAVALVRQMAAQDRLNASLVMTALCRGQLTFFTAALAHYAHIPIANAHKLIADKGEHGFRGLYAKSGLPDSMAEAIRVILHEVKNMQATDAVPGSLFYANHLVERVLAAAGHRDVEYLPYFIALIRQNIARH